MPTLKPFAPVRYNVPPGSDISTRIAPPYDVLDEGPKQALLAEDEHNIVAIDLPVTPPKTVGPDAAYAAAGALYRQWLAEGVLVRDEQPGVLAYEQVYELDGRTVRRRGMFAVLGVEEFNRAGGGIFRHEMTIAGGIGDRTRLMAATSAQLSPIFGIYPDPESKAAAVLAEVYNTQPHFHGTTAGDGVAHRCWWVTDAAKLAALEDFFRGTDVFIADGHHRYTTALQFSKDHAHLPGAGGCLFVLVAAEDPGMIVLPTHRIVRGLQGFTMQKLAKAVELRDDMRMSMTELPVEELRGLPQMLGRSEPHAVGLYCPRDRRVWLATFDADPLASILPDRPEVWRTLDVAVVQEVLIERVLAKHFGGEPAGSALRLQYTADAEAIPKLVKDDGEDEGSALAIIMQPTPLESVMAVSRVNDVMPPKSTYFYPKLATGLVINPLD